jgi:hypothetical protein
MRVNIQGKDVLYRSIFLRIWDQDISIVPDHPVVLCGWAFIKRVENLDSYLIKFKKKLIVNGEPIRPTILISDALIATYKIKKLVSTRLSKIIMDEPAVGFVFVYGVPEVKQDKKKKTHVNLTVDNLDMLDVCYDDPLTDKQR